MADIKENQETQEASDDNVQAVQCEGQSIPLSTDSTSLTSGDSVDSYRPIHSLLLCPAQWTALLESPISLVRQTSENDKNSKEVEKALDTDFAENACEQPADNISESSEDRYVVQETCCEEGPVVNKPLPLTLIETVNEEDSEHEVSEINDSGEMGNVSLESSDEKSEKDRVSQTPAHLLPVSTSSQTSSEGSCTIDGSSDEGRRGGETPSLSDRSSIPSTPLSENRLPLALLIGSHTHSRNVSETPSLPPFMSSSSSSAYHSRNSSMASQITSDCFDSDSQFTDIDSCIVTYNSDLHRPISLQEARFKFPDITSMEISMQNQSYSFSDLNLTTPIRVPEHLFVPSPKLEETLRTDDEVGKLPSAPAESFEEKHLSAAMKSSEWIKREMRRARQTMIQVKVSSKSRHVVHFNVKAGDMFVWEFATKRKDIGFGLSFEPTEIATQESPEPPEEEERTPELEMVPILPILRVNTHTHPVIGCHTATQDGVYEILFDNSYSRFFAKELYYRITTKPLIPNEHYLNQ